MLGSGGEVVLGAYLPIELKQCHLMLPLAAKPLPSSWMLTHHLIITYRADHPRAGSSCRLGSAVLIKSDSRCDVLILGGYRRAGGLRAEGNGTVRG
jgi:hypothetical protein